MTNEHGLRFVTQLARELSSGSVKLPSLPDVVLKIRRLLEQEHCDFEQIAQAVSTDAMLVSQLLRFANSAAYNATGERVESLEAAISRLGFELIKNTAISLAVKQVYLGEKHKAVAGQLRALWRRSVQLSALCHSIARTTKELDAETAYLCGLLHDVGKVYIVTKARDFPEFLGIPAAMETICEEWHPKVGKSILESWGFPDEVCQSADPSQYLNEHTHVTPSFADVTFVAERMLAAETDGAPNFATMPSSVKLGITDDVAADILVQYRNKLMEVQETLADRA